MKRFVLLAILMAPAAALADASKDAVAGAVMHGEVKVPRYEKRVPAVKDEPTASKTAPLVWFPAGKLK